MPDSMSSSYSPSWSPASSRLQLGAVSRLRSSSMKKPPEALRRAVADCLSSAASLYGAPSAVVTEASRILRDYLASSQTTDLAYSVILEHTLAERERSPAVVAKCVALLKRYLLKYKPSEETLHQIDRFCINTITEFDMSLNRKSSSWSQSLNQQYGSAAPSSNMSPLPVSSFASSALVKSLNYVRSLVSQRLPKRLFQPAGFAGAATASRLLPSLSSLLSRSFNTQLSPANNGGSAESNASALATPNSSNFESSDGADNIKYIAQDVLKWRWPVEQLSSLISAESDRIINPQDTRTRSFFEAGAAALLVGETNEKNKGQPCGHPSATDIPYQDKLLQPSSLTTAADSVSSRPHLRAITAAKRTKTGPQQIWDDSPMSTFRPRARPLFQYRHYSEQQPLRLNPAEVCEVIAAVCSEISSLHANVMTFSSRLSSNSGNPSMDVAVSVIIKLVIDMYVLDSGTAAPLTLSMLEEMLSCTRPPARARAFDLILNLGVHAHLLEPMITKDTSTIEEEIDQESYDENDAQSVVQEKRNPELVKKGGDSTAIDKFESWILSILYEILLFLVQKEEKEESVWASALSCLLYFVCDRGKIWRDRLKGLDIRVIRALLDISKENAWAEVVHCKLVCMLTNMFYELPGGAVQSTPIFQVDQIDLVGGIEFIFFEYSLANTREERRNLYLVLFDYVLHQINDVCIANGISEYGDDEIQTIASLLILADAPEAFYISIKLGVEGVVEILRGSISAAISWYPNCERLNMLLEKITEKFNTIICSFTHLDKEFSQMMQVTKSHKFWNNIEDGVHGDCDGVHLKLSWATLHSLIHSERKAYRRNGYNWLSDLLITEITNGADIWSNIRNLQQKIAVAGSHDSFAASDISLPIMLMCGLLKSKSSLIRWGFLFVLERLLMRCKCLLDENKQPSSSGESERHGGDGRLEKANAVIDVMSSGLSLVAQINETDRINILKMCDILFSQLCLKVATGMPFSNVMHSGTNPDLLNENLKVDLDETTPQKDKHCLEDLVEGVNMKFGYSISETASVAALLLRGQAIVPMQLVARVPAALFYWPLIQLAGAVTDNIALGVAVGSKGRGNIPGATSDIRATLLLLLIGKCTADPAAFEEVGGEEFFRELLDDTDSRVAYYSSAFLLKRMMTEEPDKYQHMLQSLVLRAQQCNNEKLLENPYLQMRGILQFSNE